MLFRNAFGLICIVLFISTYHAKLFNFKRYHTFSRLSFQSSIASPKYQLDGNSISDILAQRRKDELSTENVNNLEPTLTSHNVETNADNEKLSDISLNFSTKISSLDGSHSALHTFRLSKTAFAMDSVSISSSVVGDLIQKYKGKLICCSNPNFPQCDFYLCGTLHVSKSSVDMVKDVISTIKPKFVMLELCETRLNTLSDYARSLQAGSVSSSGDITPLTLWKVVKDSFRQRSVKMLGMGLLSWMQSKAAASMGNQLGGELAVAAHEGHNAGSTVVLGDRNYEVTSQRIFDRLTIGDKVKLLAIVLFEVLTMSLFRMKDYVAQSESEEGFVAEEMKMFAKHMPKLAQVVIDERDLYLAQTLCEIGRSCFSSFGNSGTSDSALNPTKSAVVAVVGAGHLEGIHKFLTLGGVPVHNSETIHKISVSSQHSVSTWPGQGRLHVVDTNKLFGYRASNSNGVEHPCVVSSDTMSKLKRPSNGVQEKDFSYPVEDSQECDY